MSNDKDQGQQPSTPADGYTSITKLYSEMMGLMDAAMQAEMPPSAIVGVLETLKLAIQVAQVRSAKPASVTERKDQARRA